MVVTCNLFTALTKTFQNQAVGIKIKQQYISVEAKLRFDHCEENLRTWACFSGQCVILAVQIRTFRG